MLKFVSGDLFEYDASVRINTVNCVGVMGKGVALAFKKRFPAMFKEYKEACDHGDVQPGRLHIWTSDDGTTVVNFPTKRHWRQNSRIEDVEDGLKALHEYLLQQGDVRVTLPALGCGHGGLEWEKVSDLIRQHLSDVTAEVLVFAPSASRNADIALRNGVDAETKKELVDAGIATLTTDEGSVPNSLSELGVSKIYVQGNTQLLEASRVACLCSASPSEREITAATLCVEELAKAGVSIVCGFGAKVERRLIKTVLENDGNVIISLPSGILEFKVPKDMQEVWDKDRIVVVSSCGPRQRWTSGGARESSRISIGLSKSVLITDLESKRWKALAAQVLKTHPIQVSYIDYQQNGADLKAMQSICAVAVRRRKDGGKPNVDHIIEFITGKPIAHEATVVAEPVSHPPRSNQAKIAKSKNGVIEKDIAKAMPESISPVNNNRRYARRLIEVDLPIARISAHARREKSIRHGHISTLHIWWARRPLAACRAVLCASLWPDPADELCPEEFRKKAIAILESFCQRVFPERITQEGRLLSSEKHSSPESRARWEAIASGTLTLDPSDPVDMPILRLCLLDFIADFANWDNSIVPAFLETSSALTASAHTALGGMADTRPIVVDPFAGGGSIPLEALRVGADAFASDLNPIPVLLNKVILEYIPRYGERLSDAVRNAADKIGSQLEASLGKYYPPTDEGFPIGAYLWARKILSDAPTEDGIPIEVPLFRSMLLLKKTGRYQALRWVRDSNGTIVSTVVTETLASGKTLKVRRPQLEVFEPDSPSEVEKGTSAGGAATCPITGYTTPVESVREQLLARRGGAVDARLICVFASDPKKSGRLYRNPTEQDVVAAEEALQALQKRVEEFAGDHSMVPDGQLNHLRGFFNVVLYGMTTWGDLFSPRQALGLTSIVQLIRDIEIQDSETEFVTAVKTCLALGLDRCADKCASLVVWDNTRDMATHVFGRQALPMIWDFAEVSLLSDNGWKGALNWVLRVIDKITIANMAPGTATQASATDHPLPDDSVDAVVSDPPYYAAIPYADLSDFFYSWLKRSVGELHPDLFNSELSPKDDECVSLSHRAAMYRHKDSEWFEETMTRACAESRRITKPSGVSVFVFANKETQGWEAMLGALISSGWIVTGSWPVDTEMANRLRAQNSAALASSVHLVCRPREDESGNVTQNVGEWRDVLAELPIRIHEWMPRLTAEGVVGADAIFACLGPALEVFSRYSRVEKSNGEVATLREYLEFVWGAVSTEALSLIFRDADASGLEPDARLTAMWLWTIGGGANGNGKSEKDEVKTKPSEGFSLAFDAARKIAQGLGVHLEQCGSFVEVKGEKAKLLPVSARTRHLFGKDTSTSTTRTSKKVKQRTLFDELDEAEAAEEGWSTLKGPPPGTTTLDRVHQAMILFAANRGELLKRFLVEDGVGKDSRFWKLADNLNKLYPAGTEERRWVEGLLARKKGLGL